MSEKTRVLFICLGNICRSPMAACVLRHLVQEQNPEKWTIHSAALGDWHVGSGGDSRMIMTLKKHKVECDHKARQIRKEDFNIYDYIFGMDEDNMSALNKMKPPGSKAKVLLFGTFDPEGETIIRDPYYDSDLDGFEKCFVQSMRSGKGFLDSLQ